jgi:hypothetical protein
MVWSLNTPTCLALSPFIGRRFRFPVDFRHNRVVEYIVIEYPVLFHESLAYFRKVGGMCMIHSCLKDSEVLDPIIRDLYYVVSSIYIISIP